MTKHISVYLHTSFGYCKDHKASLNNPVYHFGNQHSPEEVLQDETGCCFHLHFMCTCSEVPSQAHLSKWQPGVALNFPPCSSCLFFFFWHLRINRWVKVRESSAARLQCWRMRSNSCKQNLISSAVQKSRRCPVPIVGAGVWCCDVSRRALVQIEQTSGRVPAKLLWAASLVKSSKITEWPEPLMLDTDGLCVILD